MSECIGPYELRRELGRGAMAVVWEAWDTRLEREVALKQPLLPQGAAPDMGEQYVQRFLREGRAAARLNHPAIVTVYAADLADGRPYIAMELVRGRTLSDAVGGRFDLAAAVSVTDQLLDAIAYAHSRGVVHRDIKPDNVFLLSDGRVKLADFGIAHVDSASGLTQAGMVIGTPGYMAPEQVTGGQVDARTDLFAVGVIAYELMTGRNPFGASEGEAATTVMFRVVNEEPPELGDLATGVPPHVSDAVRVAMAKDPTHRFPDADSMRDALRGGPVVTGVATGSWQPAVPGVSAARQVGPAGSGGGNRAIYIGVVGLGALALVMALAAAAIPRGGASTAGAASTKAGAASGGAGSAASDPAADEAEIRRTIAEWEAAWESMDIDRYMGFYASDFYSGYRGYGYDAWRAWKAETFAKYGFQDVGIDDLEVSVSGDTARATFDQTFTSDSVGGPSTYHDFGRKTLTFGRTAGGWLIAGEEWVER